ncbi:MAG: hypothetical protein OXQ92_00965 [Boseongicola sp.]|nr:hypothetical protein [Boseongicola sp.]MDD9979239.1 hypothetical protein [Boseongicola sp.]
MAVPHAPHLHATGEETGVQTNRLADDHTKFPDNAEYCHGGPVCHTTGLALTVSVTATAHYPPAHFLQVVGGFSDLDNPEFDPPPPRTFL